MRSSQYQVVCFENYKPITVYGISYEGDMIYIGVTSMSVRSRMSQHFRRPFTKGARPTSILLGEFIKSHENIEKYVVHILDQCKLEQAAELEKKYISFYKTQDKCNMNSGGNWCAGKEHYLYGKKVDRKIIDASVAARIGKPLSDIHKLKIGAANKGLHNRQIVRGDGKEYISIIEASKELGVSPSAVLQAIRSGNRSQGHHFRYKDGDFLHLRPSRIKERDSRRIQRDDGKIYASLAELCRELMPDNPTKARNRMNGAISRDAFCFGHKWKVLKGSNSLIGQSLVNS